MKYMKDTGHYNEPRNYSNTFGKVDKTALDLINSCKYVYKDERGEYVYTAISFDSAGNVTFTKEYRTRTWNGTEALLIRRSLAV